MPARCSVAYVRVGRNAEPIPPSSRAHDCNKTGARASPSIGSGSSPIDGGRSPALMSNSVPEAHRRTAVRSFERQPVGARPAQSEGKPR